MDLVSVKRLIVLQITNLGICHAHPHFYKAPLNFLLALLCTKVNWGAVIYHPCIGFEFDEIICWCLHSISSFAELMP